MIEITECPEQDKSMDLVSREDVLMCLTGEYPKDDYSAEELISIFTRRIKNLPEVQVGGNEVQK